MAIITKIEGVDETIAMFMSLPKVLVAKGFVKGLDAAGAVFMRELWPRTPLDVKAIMNAAHGGKGLLVGRLDSKIKIDSQLRGGAVYVGFDGPLSHIANWLQWGWRLTGHKPDKKFIKDIPPTYFMTKAFEAGVDRAIDAFTEVIADTVKSNFPQGGKP